MFCENFSRRGVGCGHASVSTGGDCRGDGRNRSHAFDPEFVDAWELGLKGTFLDGSLTANLALF
jgi:outer membrane receptor protein involved in Fe transport